MYKKQDNKKYYLKDLFTGELFEFEERKLFIAYLKYKTHLYTKKGSDRIYMDNCFLHSLNLTRNDISNYYEYTYIDGNSFFRSKKTESKRYLFFDEDYIIININDLQSEIELCIDDYFEILPKRYKTMKTKRYEFKRKQRNLYNFRENPVPFISGNNKGKCSKKPRIKQAKINSCIPEYKKYIKAKRNIKYFNNFSNYYRSNWDDKNWKDCKKIKKQWMKRI